MPLDGIVDAPILRPSSAEWQDPFAYIRSVSVLVEQYGIARIIPPPDWDPPFALDASGTQLSTTARRLSDHAECDAHRARFLRAIAETHDAEPPPLGRQLDLYQLYTLVAARGGHDAVCADKGWAELAAQLKLRDAPQLRAYYQKWLLPYEKKHGAPRPNSDAPPLFGEADGGGSPNSLALQVLDLVERIPWPAIRPPHAACDWSLLRPCLLALMQKQSLRGAGGGLRAIAQAVAALEAALDDSALSERWARQARSRWRAELHGASSVAQLRRLVGTLEENIRWGSVHEAACEAEGDEAEVKKRKRDRARTSQPAGKAKKARVSPQLEAGADEANEEEKEEEKGEAHEEGGDEGVEEEKNPPEEKVARRTRHAMMQETMQQPAASAPSRREESDGSDEDAEGPPHEEGEVRTVDAFAQIAAQYKANYFAAAFKGKKGGRPGMVAPDVEVPPEKVEAEFWQLTHAAGRGERSRQMDVTYSAVATSHGAGGGFARWDEPHAAREEPYVSHAWNVHNIPRQPGCVLSHLDRDDQAVLTPKLVFGMLFSCSGWHTHRHFLHELSYLHSGAPRTWYATSGADLAAVERAMRAEASAAAFRLHDDACTLPLLLSPAAMATHHVQVSRLLQQPREFVLTLPAAFHATVGHGFHCAEEVAFASIDWLPWGKRAAAMHAALRVPPRLPFEEVILRSAAKDETVRGAVLLHKELDELLEELNAALAAPPHLAAELTPCDAAAPPPACAVCHQPAVLAFSSCACTPAACLRHPPSCGCARTLSLRHSPASLAALLAALQRRLARRQQWLDEAAAALSSRPSRAAVDELLDEARVMGLADEACERLARRAADAAAWEAQYAELRLSRGHFTLPHARALLKAGGALQLAVPAVDALQGALDATEEWQGRADALLARARPNGAWAIAGAASREEVEHLLSLPQAEWLRLPQAAELRNELDRLALVEQIAKILSTSRVPLSEVKAVLEDATKLSLDHLADVVELQQRHAVASKWGQRANLALKRRTALAALESLLAEADPLSVHSAQAEEVRERIAEAQDWSARAREAIERRSDVETVRALMEQGEQLNVTVPEEDTIREMVNAADWWIKRASGAFLKRGCPAALLDVVQDDPRDLVDEAAPGSSSVGASGLACLYCTGNDTATLNRFMIGCDGCRRWYHGPCVGVGKAEADAMEDYVCPLCAEAKGAAYAFPPAPAPKYTRRPRLRQVTSLLTEAGEIGIEMPEVARIWTLQAAAEEWQARAEAVLEGEWKDPAEVEALAREGEACEVEPEALAPLRKLRGQLAAWLASAASVLRGEVEVDVPLTEEEVEAEELADEEEENEEGRSGAAGEETRKSSQKPSEKGEAGGSGEASDEEGRAAGSKEGSLGGEEEREKDKEARRERPPRRGEKARPRVAPNSVAGLRLLIGEARELGIACAELEGLRDMAARARRWRVGARAALNDTAEVDEAQLDALLGELSQLPLRLQARALLQRKLKKKRWLLCRRAQLAAALSGVPPLDYLRTAVEEAAELGLDGVEEVVAAASRVEEAEEWQAQAEEALAAEANIHVLKELRDDAARLGVRLPLLDAVGQRIEDSQDWGKRATAALCGAVTLEQLAHLLRQAERAAVPLAQRAALIERKAAAEWWQGRAAALFLKAGCTVSLCEALQGDGLFPLLGDDGEWCATLGCAYCTGEDPAATSQFMIGCDACGRWYHGPCVGVPKAEAETTAEYLCPACAAAKGKEYAFGAPPHLKRTRRPALRVVRALLGEAAELQIDMAEARLLGAAREAAEAWEARAAAHVAQMEAGGAALDATRRLVDDGDALEVVPQLFPSLQRHVMLRREWSEAVDELHAPPHEARRGSAVHTAPWDALECAAALGEQAALLRVPPDASARLAAALAAAPRWRDEARAALRAPRLPAGVPALLGRSEVHVSPEYEMLKLALVRHEMLPSLDGVAAEPATADDDALLHAHDEVL
ncbi:hypothetical protein AB1Y20_020746 [Prymnesium parvum]|uniref:[Histone H3]-trimethyl-L-lysine(4) demethylase n=1 Tax=Prymnesium parvum TaxID=97485 RepID=A0AB34JW44_PRYPA